MKKLVEHLKEQFDYILLDCPAGIEQGFKNAIAGADRALVVTTPEVSAIRDADRIIGLLEASGFERIDLVINRMRYEMVRRGDMMSVDDVVDILSIPLIGVVPDDENVVIATNQGESLVGNHTLADAPTGTSASGFWGRRPRICFRNRLFRSGRRSPVFFIKVRRDAYETV